VVCRPTTVVLGDWVDRAACRDDDTAIYFPDRGDASALTLARERCAACPVRAECLDYALGFPAGELQGVWGGLSQRERRRLRSRMGVTSSA
jgi:WhiB family redox-sensing transcriptional regulator